jgi:hypothetical protein
VVVISRCIGGGGAVLGGHDHVYDPTKVFCWRKLVHDIVETKTVEARVYIPIGRGGKLVRA